MLVLDARYEFLSQVPSLAPELREIPGVWVANNTVSAPRNAAWLVEDMLRTAGIVWTTELRCNPARSLCPAPGQETHPWLWASTQPTLAEPIRFLPYQREGILFARLQGGAHIWAPAGSGKTLMGFEAAFSWPGPVICVTRAAAREQHADELRTYTSVDPLVIDSHSVAVEDYCGRMREADRRPVAIIGWELLPYYVQQLIQLQPSTVIFDESHKAKQPRRWKWTLDDEGRPKGRLLDSVSAAAWLLASRIRHRIATTATPVRHRLWDLYGQLTLVEPYAWGKTPWAFFRRYCAARPGKYGWTYDGVANLDELKRRLAFTAFRVPTEVLTAQLPPMRRQIIRVPADSLVAPLAQPREEAAKDRSIKAAAAKGAPEARLALRERMLADAASQKRGIIRGLLEAHKATGRGKLLVFTGRKRDVDHLAEVARAVFAQVWVAYGSGNVDGNPGAYATTAVERYEIQKAYMAHPGPCVVVGTIDAWGESRNLQDTDVEIVAMLPWTTGAIEQLEGRPRRLGQDRPLLIIYPVAEGTIDERVAGSLIEKLPVVGQVSGSTALLGFDRALAGLDEPGLLESMLEVVE